MGWMGMQAALVAGDAAQLVNAGESHAIREASRR